MKENPKEYFKVLDVMSIRKIMAQILNSVALYNKIKAAAVVVKFN